jgi:hypothetical protein
VPDLLGLAGGGQDDALPRSPDALEEGSHAREGAGLGQVPRLVEPLAVLLDLLAAAPDVVRRQEDGHELVAALADLAADVGEGDLAAEVPEGLLPSPRVQVDSVDQRAVDVEDHRSHRHAASPVPRRPSRTNGRGRRGLRRGSAGSEPGARNLVLPRVYRGDALRWCSREREGTTTWRD